MGGVSWRDSGAAWLSTHEPNWHKTLTRPSFLLADSTRYHTKTNLTRRYTDYKSENSAKPCDTGTPAPALGEEFPIVDYSTLDPVYPDKSTPAGQKYAYNKKALLARGQSALRKLYDRPEKVIIVVSHSGFLRLCVSGCWYYNSDYRIFEFEEHLEDGEPYRLKQSVETLENGGGLGLSIKHPVALGDGLPEEKLTSAA